MNFKLRSSFLEIRRNEKTAFFTPSNQAKHERRIFLAPD